MPYSTNPYRRSWALGVLTELTYLPSYNFLVASDLAPRPQHAKSRRDDTTSLFHIPPFVHNPHLPTPPDPMASPHAPPATRSLWLSVATAATTSTAVERAALLPPDSPLDLPHPPGQLSRHALANLRAVSRALCISFPGIPAAPPRPGPPVEALCGEGALKAHGVDAEAGKRGSGRDKRRRNGEDAVGGAEGRRGSKRARKERQEAVLEGVDPGNASRAGLVDGGGAVREAGIGAAAAPSAEELQAAKSLSQWATSSPHAPPPGDALSVALAAENAESVVRAMFPEELVVDAVAALLACVGEGCGARFATAVGEAVVGPRVRALTEPAPRELMKAVVGLAEKHWRAVVPLYALVGGKGRGDGKGVGGPSAEVLVRCASVLPREGLRDALLLCCGGVWQEEGVPVVEALLGKCKGEDGVTDALVGAFERSVGSLEKSVRFGKLLFIAVKEFPEARQLHAARIRNVAAKSKVYLAKRAVGLLDKGG